jgi:peptide/nickel transport system ATP-binding protein
LTVRYSGSTPVIERFSMSLDRGDRVGITGESGCGKSTLLKTITRLLPDSAACEGSLDVSGAIGYIPQEGLQSLSPYLPAADQVTDLTHSREETRRLFARVGLGEPRFQHVYPHQLSGGERQRVLAVQALAVRPNVIVADEPTSNLDAANEEVVLELLDEYARETGAAILIASHRERVFGRLGCRVHTMAGTLAAPAELGTIERKHGDPLLTVRDLSKQYFRRDWLARQHPITRALDHVSLEVFSGECVAVTGRSGAGKSTLARCIAGREASDAGSIEWHGDRQATPRERVQLVQQEPSESLNPRMTISEVLREACGEADPGLLEAVRLPGDWLGRKVTALSEGQRARIAIARSAARLKGGLLILDESLSGLDRATRGHIVNFLTTQQQNGLSILLITHDLNVAQEFGARILRMEAGRVSAFEAVTATAL